MNNQCKQCGSSFDPLVAKEYAQVHGISLPVYCRLCSWQRKLAWENEYNVYKRKCDATGRELISVYSSEVKFPVYDKEYWISEEWEVPFLEYDQGRPFLEQYFELSEKVPRPHANCVNAENSEYTHLVFDSKNAYLSFQVFLSDKVIGCYRVVRMKDSVNSFFCIESELLCECVNCAKSYNLKFCEDSEDCSDSAFLFDCRGCRNCFMCWNLRNKQFCYKNEQLTREEYEKRISGYGLRDSETLLSAKKEFEVLREKFVVKSFHQINCEKCFGDYLVGCKGCKEIYFSDGCEDSDNILRGTEDINCFDCVVGGKIELCYGLLQPGYSYKCAYGISCNHCNEVYLSEYLDNCKDCTGCVSLKRRRNCVLNKQYSPEEYRKLKAHIFAELCGDSDGGFDEFFDPERSPFKYEETIADLYFPRSGFSGEIKFSEKGRCVYCGRSLQFSAAEKGIYERMGVCLSEACFNCRIQSLSRPYSVVEMEKYNCVACGNEVFQGKSSRKFGKLYCEKCYLAEVY